MFDKGLLENALLQLLRQLQPLFQLTAGMLHRQCTPGSPTHMMDTLKTLSSNIDVFI